MESELLTLQVGPLSSDLCGRYWTARCGESEPSRAEGRQGRGGKYVPNALCVGTKGAFDHLARDVDVDMDAVLKQGVPWGGPKTVVDRRQGERCALLWSVL
jgi:hypothetical protein